MIKKFKRDLQSLEIIFSFVTDFCVEEKLDQDTHFMMDLVLEELFTNALRYNPDNGHEIMINLDISDDTLTIVLVEYDVDAFDLNSQQVYDLSAPLQERPVGKLGIHFIKKMLDSVKNEYTNRQNKIILTKKLNKTNA